MRHLEAARAVLTRPRHLFARLRRERGVRGPLIYLVALTAAALVFLTLYYLRELGELLRPYGITLGRDVRTYALLFATLLVVMVLLSALRYSLTHLFVRAFNAKARYDATISALTYTLTPSYIAAPLFVAAAFALPYARLSGAVWAWTAFIICAAGFALASAYEIYVRVLSLMHVQGLHWWQSALCIYVLGLGAQILVVALVEAALLMVIFGAALLIGGR